MNKQYFGTDGIRGRVGEGHITPEFILKLGWAAGRVLGKGAGGLVLIGKDTRISGYMFESALEAGLVAAGVNIRLLGPMPTPGVAYLTRTFHANAGIVISASHNAFHDNGIKFFSADGNKLPDDIELAIEAELQKPMTCVSSELLGKAMRLDDAAGRYIEFCKSTIPAKTDLTGLKIVMDCAHGAAYHIAPHVLTELGAEVIRVGTDPDGLNINQNVGSTHIATLQQSVKEHAADLGVALDGDGDRVIMVDHEGNEVDGDGILYVIAMSRKQAGQLQGTVVGTLMSNLGLELALREQGIAFERTNVGDRYILGRLIEESWELGGEPSGHIICRDRTTTGDGMVSALQVLAAMCESKNSLKNLCQGMQIQPQKLINVDLGKASVKDVMGNQTVQAAVTEIERQFGKEGRVLLRPSGTEPLIRVMVEGREPQAVDDAARHIADAVVAIL